MDDINLVKIDKEYQDHASRIHKFIEQSRTWFILVIVCTAATPFLSYGLYNSVASDEIKAEFFDHAESVSIAAAALVDSEVHARISRNAEIDEDYGLVLNKLARLQLKLPDIYYLYTLVVEGERAFYGIDINNSQISRIRSPDTEALGPMTPYDTTSDDDFLAFQAIRENSAFVYPEPITSAKGTFVRACAPIAAIDGALPTATCIDIDAAVLFHHLDVLRNRQILISVITALFCLFIYYSVVQHQKQIRFTFNILQKQRDLYLKNSHTDPLTNALNLRSFNLVFNTAEAQFQRNRLQFAVIAIDIDHFKAINDTYGHDTGDTVLIEVVNTIQEALRVNDYLTRMGGEEFAVICTIASDDDAVLVAEKLRAVVEELEVKSSDNRIVKLTISLGVYVMQTGSSREKAVKAADIALYHAKQNGRNRVVRYTSELEEGTPENGHSHG